MCQYCHLFENEPCLVCAVAPVSRRKSTPKTSVKQAVKHERAATMAELSGDLDELYAMLLDGRLHDAVKYGKAYRAVVDRLQGAGYPVAKYRTRIVSGKST